MLSHSAPIGQDDTHPGPGPGDVTGVAVILAPSVHQHQLPGPHGGRGGDVVDNLQLTAFSDGEHLCEDTEVVGKS